MAASLGPISDGKMDNSFWLDGADDGKRESMGGIPVLNNC